MKLSALLFILALSLQLYSQDKPAYKVFTGEGKMLIIKISLKR